MSVMFNSVQPVSRVFAAFAAPIIRSRIATPPLADGCLPAARKLLADGLRKAVDGEAGFFPLPRDTGFDGRADIR